MIALIGGLALVLQLPPVRARLRDQIVRKLEQALGTAITIDGLEYSLWGPTATFSGVSIRTRTTALELLATIKRLHVEIPLEALFGDFSLRSVDIEGARLFLAPLTAQMRASPPGAPSGTSIPDLPIDHIQIRGLDIVGSDAQSVRLDGNGIALDLNRTGPRHILAELHARNGVTVKSPTLSLTFVSVDGTLALNGDRLLVTSFRARAPEVDLSLSGEAVVAGRSPGLALRAEAALDLNQVALHAAPRLAPASGVVLLKLDISGSLTEPRIVADAAAARMEISGVRFASVAAKGSANGRRVALDSFVADLMEGRVTGSAAIDPGGANPDRLQLTWNDINSADVLPLLGLKKPVRMAATVDGRADLSGSISSPDSIVGRIEVTLRRRAGGGLSPEGRLVANLERETVTINLNQRLEQLATLDGHINTQRTFQGSDRLTGRLTLAALDAGRLSQSLRRAGLFASSAQLDALRGPFAAAMDLGGTIDRPTAEVTLDAPRLVMADAPALTARVEASIAPEGLSVHSARIDEGANLLEASGQIDLNKESITGRFGATVADLNALRKIPGFDSAVLPAAGHFSFTGTVDGRLQSPTVAGTLAGRDLAWADQYLTSLDAAIGIDGFRVSVHDFTASQGTGRVRGSGSYDLRTEAYQMDVNADDVHFSTTAPRATGTASSAPTLSMVGSGHFKGSGTLSAPSGSGDLTLSELHWNGRALGPARGRVTIDRGTARIESQAENLGLHLTGTISTSRPWQFKTSVAIDRPDAQWPPVFAAPISDAPVFRGAIAATVSAQGSLAEWKRADLSVDLKKLDGTLAGLPVMLSRPARLDWNGAGLTVPEDLSLTIGGLAAAARGYVDGSSGRFNLTMDGDLKDAAPLLGLVTRRPLSLEGRVHLKAEAGGSAEHPTLVGELSVENGRLNAGSAHPIALSGTITLDQGMLRADALSATWQDASATTSASIPLRFAAKWLPAMLSRLPSAAGPATATIRLTNATPALLSSFLPADRAQPLRGSVDASVSLEAAEPAFRSVQGTVTVDRAQLNVGEVAVEQVGTTTATVAAGRIDFSGWQWSGPSTDMTLGGHASLGDSFEYDVGGIGTIDLQLLGIVMPGRFAGRAKAIVRVTPQNGKPDVTGRLVLNDGAWFDRGLQVALSDVSGIVRLDEDVVRLDDLRGNFNGGDLTIDGSLTGPDPTLIAKGRAITVELPGGVRADMDADLKLTLGAAPSLTGKVSLLPSTVRSSLRSLASLAGAANEQSGQPARTGTQEFLQRIKLDVAVDSTEDLVFDSNDLRLQVGAELKLTGTIAQPGLLGRATIREGGEIYFSGRRYTISTGSIEFVDARGIVPNFNIVSDSRVGEYNVTMRLTGRPSRLTTTLTSDPPLGQNDLVSLLTTGRTIAQGGSSSQSTSNQLLALASTDALGIFGRLFGLDVVRIEQGSPDLSATDLDPVARLTVSKYLTNGFEMVYSQSLRESGDQIWILLFRPGWKNLEFRLNVRALDTNTLEVRQEFTWGGGRAAPTIGQRRRKRPAGPVIRQVDFVGVEATERLDLEGEIKLKAGKQFDLGGWQKDRERLERYFWQKNHLRVRVAPSRRVNTEDKTINLTYTIDPGPLTRLTVEGYEPSSDTIDQMREAWSRAAADEFLNDILSETARRELAARGYLQSEIVASIRPLGTEGDREAVVSVTPGRVSKNRAVVLNGNHDIGDAPLLQAVDKQVPEPDRWLHPERVKAPIDDTYRSRGYLNVQITVGKFEFDGDRVALPVTIDEGKPFQVGRVVVQGRERLEEARVLRAFGLAAGAAYTPPAAIAGLDRVQEAYRRQGFDEVTVKISSELDRQAATISLALTVVEGPRRVLESVSFEGATGTSRGLLNEVIDTDPGDPGGASTIERARQRLYQTGIFRSVDLDVPTIEPSVPPATGDQPVRATFKLEELPRYRFRYGVQFGSQLFQDTVADGTQTDDRGLTLDFRRNNLFGQGIAAGIGGTWGPSRRHVRGLVSGSVFMGNFAESTLFIDHVDETQTIGQIVIDQVETIVTAEQRVRFDRRNDLAYGFQLDMSTVTLDFPPFGKFPFDTQLSGLTTTWTRDTRNSFFNPTLGLFMSNRLEAGARWMASDVGYFRYYGQFYAYRSAGPIIVASGVRVGTLNLANLDELSTMPLRFQAGGGTTVRGYDQDSLSPQLSQDFPLGGNAVLIFNEEVRFPIWGYLGGVGFIDAGNTFPQVHLMRFSDLKVGVGFGLRLNIPFAVFRVDLGFPWPREENGPRNRLYFSIGQAF